MTQQALTDGIQGTVVIEAVLCRDGQVTDLVVLQTLPGGLTDEAIRSVLGIEFTPAEINFHSVSQKMRFEFSFNERKSGVINSKDAEGKPIKAIEIVGNRNIPTQAIIAQLKTQLGENYSEEQVRQDLANVLSTGYFDPGGTSVTTEAEPSGDIILIFEVQEVPFISDLQFEGLGRVSEVRALTALLDQNIDLRRGSRYNGAKVKTALSIIKNLFEKSGEKDVRVDTRIEQISVDNVFLTFVISH